MWRTVVGSDEKLFAEIDNQPWTEEYGPQVQRNQLPASRKTKMSLSGSEPNKLFVQTDGKYADLSGLSGMDSRLDSRCIANWDFNRDGYQDFLVVNTNGAMLHHFRNNLGRLISKQPNFVAINFVGGAKPSQSQSTEPFSNRDGIGARVKVKLPNTTIERELRCGEGFGAQSSSTLVIGYGDYSQPVDLEVLWPSGRKQTAKAIKSGTRVTFFEDKSECPDSNGFTVVNYEAIKETQAASRLVKPVLPGVENLELKSDLTLVTSMATWCQSCRAHLPKLKQLDAMLGDEIDIVAIPTDKNESDETLNKYVDKFQPPYRLVKLDQKDVEQMEALLASKLKTVALPSSMIVDSEGRIHGMYHGLPNVSVFKQIRDEMAK